MSRAIIADLRAVVGSARRPQPETKADPAADPLERVRQDGMAIEGLSEEQRTPEVVMAAVRQNGRAIGHLRPSQRTPEVVMAAVRQSAEVLVYLRENNLERTPEVLLAAVEQNGYAVCYLWGRELTPELCLAAVRQNGDAIDQLGYLHRTPEVWLQALSKGVGPARFLKAYDLKPQGTAADALKDLLLKRWPDVKTLLPEQTRVAVAKVLLAHADAVFHTNGEVDGASSQDQQGAEQGSVDAPASVPPRHYAVTGRIPFDEEDTTHIFQTDRPDDLEQMFEDAMYEAAPEISKPSVLANAGVTIFINSVLVSDAPITEVDLVAMRMQQVDRIAQEAEPAAPRPRQA